MPPLLPCLQVKRAALPAISEVNHKSQGEPYKETDPVHDRQACHQQETGENRENWRQRAAGGAEGAVAIGLAVAKNEHAGSNESECEQRADVGEIGEGADVEQAGGNPDHETRDPSGKVRSQIAAVHTAEDFRKEAV